MSQSKNPGLAVLKNDNGAEKIGFENETVKSALNQRTIYVKSVAEDFYQQEGLSEAQYQAIAWHPGGAAQRISIGGGPFVFKVGIAKSLHNGGTIISPTVPPVSAGSVADFLNGVGETDPTGTGCYVRESDGIYYPDEFGAKFTDADDDTASVQACANAAPTGGTVFYRYPAMKIQGQIDIPRSQSHEAKYNRLQISRLSENNGQSFYKAVSVSGIIEFKNIATTANMVKFGTGYDSTAANFRPDECADVRFYNCFATGGPSGINITRSNGLLLKDTELTGNFLTGLSGTCHNITMDGAHIHRNGDDDPAISGLTHDVYIVNSKNGKIRNSKLGPCIDTATIDVMFKYSSLEGSTGYTEFKDWLVEDCIIEGSGNALGFISTGDNASDRAGEAPQENIEIRRTKTPGLRLECPLNCKTSNNDIGLFNIFSVSTQSFVPSLTSRDDTAEEIRTVFTSGYATDETKFKKMVFIRPIINNGVNAALTSGGTYPAGVFIEPEVTGSGDIMDSNVGTRYSAGNPSVVIASRLNLASYHRDNYAGPAVEQTGNPIVPDNSLPYTDTVHILLQEADVVNNDFTISPPAASAFGMTLKLVIRTLIANSPSLTFDPVYRITSDTAAQIGALAQQRALCIEFKNINGVWAQMGEASFVYIG